MLEPAPLGAVLFFFKKALANSPFGLLSECVLGSPAKSTQVRRRVPGQLRQQGGHSSPRNHQKQKLHMKILHSKIAPLIIAGALTLPRLHDLGGDTARFPHCCIPRSNPPWTTPPAQRSTSLGRLSESGTHPSITTLNGSQVAQPVARRTSAVQPSRLWSVRIPPAPCRSS